MGDAHGFCDVVVRFLFDQSQRRHQAIFWRKLLESFSDPLAGLAADGGIRGPCAGQIFREFGFAVRMPEMVESRVGRDPSRPGTEITCRVEARSRFVPSATLYTYLLVFRTHGYSFF